MVLVGPGPGDEGAGLDAGSSLPTVPATSGVGAFGSLTGAEAGGWRRTVSLIALAGGATVSVTAFAGGATVSFTASTGAVTASVTS